VCGDGVFVLADPVERQAEITPDAAKQCIVWTRRSLSDGDRAPKGILRFGMALEHKQLCAPVVVGLANLTAIGTVLGDGSIENALAPHLSSDQVLRGGALTPRDIQLPQMG
jgi:hypothetical protein